MKLYSIIGLHEWYVEGKDRFFLNEEVFTFLEEFEDDAAADAWCVGNSVLGPEEHESWVYRRWANETGVWVTAPDGALIGPVYPEESLEARYIDQAAWRMHLAHEAEAQGLS